MRVMMEWGGHRGQCNRFLGICLATEENRETRQLGYRRGDLVVRPVIASNGVPFLYMKLVGPRYQFR